MLSDEQASAMLALQAEINRRIDPRWVEKAFPYLRAVIVEGAEAIEHHGWKWWKRQHRDLAQLQMELVDIWHFLLSEILLREDGDEQRALASLMQSLAGDSAAQPVDFDGCSYDPEQMDLLRKLELLIGLSANHRIDLGLFGAIMADCGMDWSALHRQYVGKNVLNLFRQDHGYKEGRYRKHWSGREDNEHLAEILDALDPAAAGYREKVYRELKQRYLQ